MTGPEPRGLPDLDRGRAAFEGHRWADAFKALSAADGSGSLAADDLVLLAWSAYLIARHDDFLRAMERAHHSHLVADDVPAAVRCAFWLAFVLVHRGELGPASGWAGRATRLCEQIDTDCAELGYLVVGDVLAHAMVGAWPAVHDRATDALNIGERFRDADLTAFARHWQGRALVRLHRVAEGFALLDEAMVSATSDRLSPVITGLIYCSMIEACQEVYDLRRSEEWTRSLSAWCDAQPDLVPFTSQCLVHRAELLFAQGEWEAALGEAARARDLATKAGDRGAAAAAYYLCGEIHRLRGEHDRALEAYEQSHLRGREPQPGMALVRLARGDTEAARTAIRRACDETDEPLDRARLLPSLVAIMVASGRPQDARAASDELADTAAAFGSSVLHAIAASSRATLDLLADDARAALRRLREAERTWQQLGATYELACVQVAIAGACAELGDDDTAALHRDAARERFRGIGAAFDLDRLDALEATTSYSREMLSRRELEVLRLVTAGKTNKLIAAELYLSEKTVERHVSNILTKLGVPSRAAATAYAYEHGIV